MVEAKKQYYGTGRRKTSVARVFLRPGSGRIVINTKPFEAYLTNEMAAMIIQQPLKVLGKEGQFDVKATVRGGGISGQAGAVRLGISRALLQYAAEVEEPVTDAIEGDEKVDGEVEAKVLTIRCRLKQEGLLTRDSRKVERKKPGLRKARKRVQYSKR